MEYKTIETALRNASESVNLAIQQVQLAKMKDEAVSCHIQIARYFKIHDNKPTTYTEIATAIGRPKKYVANVLSGYYKFQKTQWGKGWKMRKSCLKQVL